MYIRFGMHKDRDVLMQMRDGISGIVLPAHILSHSADATRAAVDYIDRDFFIDPMTYIFTSDNIKYYLTKDKKDSSIRFKASIEKLTTDYGLLDFFKSRDYSPLLPTDFTSEFSRQFALKNYNFQRDKLNGQADSAYKKYADILAKVTAEEYSIIDHKPVLITPPYFYSSKTGDTWHDVNLRLAEETSKLAAENETVAPVVLTKSDNLTPSLLDSYSSYKQIILWVTDLDESKVTNDKGQINKLTLLKNFVELARQNNMDVINLYGSYYSAILEKYGMSSFCNGIFYGEYKNFQTKVGGGAPPARFYISAIHKFYIIPVAVAIMQDNDQIFLQEPEETQEMLDGLFENMFQMIKDPSLAQKHFLYARKKELEYIKKTDIHEVIDSLKQSYDMYGNFDETISKDTPLQLLAWYEALRTP